MPQPAIWRRQSANTLKNLLEKIPSTGLVGEALSCHVDDLIRSLSGLPKLPVDQVPYQEIFAVADVNIGRSKAAEKLRVLLVNMQDGWHPNDGLVDDLIRELSGLSKRTLDQIPYQEVFAETDVNLVTTAQLCAIAPEADPALISALTIPLNLAMVEFDIISPLRQTHFLALVAKESGQFQLLEELTSGEQYEGVVDLGNTEPGDGVRFKGRGLFHIVGRTRYKECSEALGVDLIIDPQRLADPDLACRSAAWFWNLNQFNMYADRDDFESIDGAFYGTGYSGGSSNTSFFEAAKRAINLEQTKVSFNFNAAVGYVAVGGDNVVGDYIPRIKFDDVAFSPVQPYYPTRSYEPSQELSQAESVNSVQNLKRYPNLDCPDKQILNQMYGLEVSLLLDKPEGESPEAMIIRDTGTSELPELEIWVTAQGFDLVSGSVKKIKVKRNELSKVRFTLIPRRLGENNVKAKFFQYDELIGSISRNILVLEEIIEQTVSQPSQSPSIPVKTALTIPPQDLDLLIDLDRDRRTLRFRLNSWKKEINLGFSDCGQVTLEGSPLEKMQAVYKEMTEMARKIPLTLEDKKQAEERLDAVGNKLWDELTPENFKQAYWKFKSRVKSILITSEEPWIPWEMLKPYRYDDNGEQENDSFWCQQFAMSRWLSGGGTADELDITSSRAISPTKSNLPSTQEEIAFLNQLSSLRPNIIHLPSFSTKQQVLDSLKNEELSILHFACHGLFDSTSPNDSAIMLSDAPLRPSDIRVAFGTKKKPQRPLIFLNACYGGQAEFGFTGLGGWAERFVKANAGAFVGAMWEVTDRLALQFAKAFYSALLRDNQSIAESFRQAREEIRQLAPYNSTWLAYTLYADPEGRVKNNGNDGKFVGTLISEL